MSTTGATTSKAHLFFSLPVRRGRRLGDPAAAVRSTPQLPPAPSGDQELAGQC
jgi:hypothetical protein